MFLCEVHISGKAPFDSYSHTLKVKKTYTLIKRTEELYRNTKGHLFKKNVSNEFDSVTIHCSLAAKFSNKLIAMRKRFSLTLRR